MPIPAYLFSFRTFLLLTTAMTLVACDDAADDAAQTQAEQYRKELEQKVTGFYDPMKDAYPDRTVSGNFLAGLHAQQNGDWKKASDYFASIKEFDPNATHLDNRIMALSIGSGQYEQSLAIAKKLAGDTSSDQSLAGLLLAIDALKSNDYTAALAALAAAPKKGIGGAIFPLVQTWAEIAAGKKDVKPLDIAGSPSLAYQSVLMAAYTDNTAQLTTLARDIDFAMAPVTIRQLETVAAIFATKGQTLAAAKIYTALRNALPDRADHYAAQLKAIEDKNFTAITLLPMTPQIAVSQALTDVAKLLSGNFQDSARIFGHLALFLSPSQEESLELLAQLAADAGQHDEATMYLARIDTRGDDAKRQSVQRQIALLLQDAGKKDDAILVLEKLVKDSGSIEAQIQIGDIYRSNEQYADALVAYNRASAMLGDNIPHKYWALLFSRGMVQERLKNWALAEKDLQAALTYEPDQPYVLNYLGYSWADQGRNLDKAAEMIEKAVRLRPQDGAIVDSLGWVYYRMGKYDKAVKTLERAIELAPTEAEINDHLGDAYWKVGRRNEARFQWNRAISFAKQPDLIAAIQNKLENGLISSTTAGATAAEKLVKNQTDDSGE